MTALLCTLERMGLGQEGTNSKHCPEQSGIPSVRNPGLRSLRSGSGIQQITLSTVPTLIVDACPWATSDRMLNLTG
jgi:hypothetical protein